MWQVHGLPAQPRLTVQRSAEFHKPGDIGNRVVDQVPVARPGDVHRLVKVGGFGRVDGHKLDLAPVDGRKLEAANGLLRFRQHFRRERGAQLEFSFKRTQGLGQVGGLCMGRQSGGVMAHNDSITTPKRGIGQLSRVCRRE